jgi:hypothetical protein
MVGKKYTWLLSIRTACRRSAEYRAADKANVKLYIQNRTLCVNTRALTLFEHVVATDASNLEQDTCSLALPVYLPRVNRPLQTG